MSGGIEPTTYLDHRHREGLSSQGGLVHVNLALIHNAISRHSRSRTYPIGVKIVEFCQICRIGRFFREFNFRLKFDLPSNTRSPGTSITASYRCFKFKFLQFYNFRSQICAFYVHRGQLHCTHSTYDILPFPVAFYSGNGLQRGPQSSHSVTSFRSLCFFNLTQFAHEFENCDAFFQI